MLLRKKRNLKKQFLGAEYTWSEFDILQESTDDIYDGDPCKSLKDEIHWFGSFQWCKPIKRPLSTKHWLTCVILCIIVECSISIRVTGTVQ